MFTFLFYSLVILLVIALILVKQWKTRVWFGFGMVFVGTLVPIVARFVNPQWLSDLLFVLILGIPIGYAVGFYAGVTAGKEKQHKTMTRNVELYMGLGSREIVSVVTDYNK